MQKRNSKLIKKKFYQYLIPSILTVVAMQFSSLFDGIIIGNFLGPDCLCASSMVLPIIYIAQAPGLALGVGGAIVCGMMLGKRDIENANKAFSSCIILGLFISLVIAILSPFVSKPLASLFADELLEYSYEYLFMYLLCDPIITFAILISSFMAVDNNPKLSSAFFITSNIVKLLSMFLFINVFKMGMYGAALSLPFGFVVGFISLIIYVKSSKRLLKFTFRIKGTSYVIKESIKASSATAINYILTAIQMTIVNIVISSVVLDVNDIIIYGLIVNLVFIFDLASGGFLSLIPTICGIFYGEKDIFSLKSVTRRIYYYNILISSILTVVILLQPNIISFLFGVDKIDEYKNGLLIIRIYVISFIPYEINKFSTNYYPSINKNIPSYITVFLREAILVLPITLILVNTNGILGYSIAALVVESLTVLLTYIFIIIYNLKTKKTKTIFMFEALDYISYDFTLKNDINNVSIVSADVVNFLSNNSISNRECQVIGLAVEEITSNIISYGYKRQKDYYIDINIKVLNDSIILRVRDDGYPFDPTKYEIEDDIKYLTSGINLVKNLSDKMTYMRVLNLNNTIIEINLKGV